MPEYATTAHSWLRQDMWDYEFQERWGVEHHNYKAAKRTAILVGIRTDESLNRWRAIYKDRDSQLHSLPWTKQVAPQVYNCYPIFDWSAQDIWTANGRFGWDYNRLYDLFHQAGMPLAAMRVASPFIGTAQSSLHLYRVIEPNTWGKLVSRVNGVNFTGIYGGTTAMGWKSIRKPQHLTWKEYCEFLLSTLPAKAAENYRAKLLTSIRFWRERGGVMDSQTIEQLQAEGVDLELVGHSYQTDKQAVRMDYQDDTGADDFQHVPTYKRMCVCIMKNDHLCKYMGFTLTKREQEQRAAAVAHYQDIL
jgi:predicted phosphoadenosine phosphosulfate sulfurtransferase